MRNKVKNKILIFIRFILIIYVMVACSKTVEPEHPGYNEEKLTFIGNLISGETLTNLKLIYEFNINEMELPYSSFNLKDSLSIDENEEYKIEIVSYYPCTKPNSINLGRTTCQPSFLNGLYKSLAIKVYSNNSKLYDSLFSSSELYSNVIQEDYWSESIYKLPDVKF